MTQKTQKILVADDEFHMRMMISSLIKTMNIEVAGEAMNGAEAVSMYRKTMPDLTLLDINMPVKTGEEALREIMAEFPDARVIMLTSVADMQTVEACLNAGARNFIRKDSPLSEIKEAILQELPKQGECDGK